MHCNYFSYCCEINSLKLCKSHKIHIDIFSFCKFFRMDTDKFSQLFGLFFSQPVKFDAAAPGGCAIHEFVFYAWCFDYFIIDKRTGDVVKAKRRILYKDIDCPCILVCYVAMDILER